MLREADVDEPAWLPMQADIGSCFQLTLENTLVSSAPAPAGDHSKWVLMESFSGPLLRHRPQRPDGTRGDPVFGTWDTSGRFIGDPTVFDAFTEMCAVRGPDDTLSITSAVPEPVTWALWLVGAAVAARRLRQLPR